MELVVKFSKHIKNYVSVETVVKNYINTGGIQSFNLIILKDLKSKVEDHSFNSIQPLQRTFDCCIWLIRNNLLSAQYLFTNLNLEVEVIFNCARNFVHLVNKIKIEAKEDDLTILSKEFEDLQTLQCQVIIAMFDFLQILLNLEVSIFFIVFSFYFFSSPLKDCCIILICHFLISGKFYSRFFFQPRFLRINFKVYNVSTSCRV